MKLQTEVIDEKCRVGISYKDKIMILGSCFSDNIGIQLADLGFDVCINPFGTLYNPASIFSSIERLISREPFTDNDCVEIGAGNKRICSFYHHTSCSAKDKEEFLERANNALEVASDYFKECNKVIITLGTSWCFRHISTDRIVSNCLKHPASEFQRERISPEETTRLLNKITGSKYGKEKEFIFTVSPIRHFKDGAHGNQLSKAGLMLGIDGALNSRSDYFPAYEIVMDELRDYRFYAEDMCHPTSQTTAYIRDRFLNWALPEEDRPLLEEKIREFKRSRHIEKTTIH